MKWVVITMWTLAAIVGMFGSGSLVGSFIGIALLFGGVLVCNIDQRRDARDEKRRSCVERHEHWCVWVNGSALNSGLTEEEANVMADAYEQAGFMDVQIGMRK